MAPKHVKVRIHFIAIGGSAMHNLALALQDRGYRVSGSDDEIFEPSRTRLDQAGLLPEQEGWYPERITADLDAVILGMHARAENPELARARELKVPVFSYPEFLYEESKDKKRVVIGGSHGKTTITAMILHVLKLAGINADYMVGAQLEGFDVMVRLSKDAGIMVLEGDEYLSSALDPQPKFHIYRPHLALISGIAWDHINVFPTFGMYVEQFELFIQKIESGGALVYCSDDRIVEGLAKKTRDDIARIPYGLPGYHISDGISYLDHKGRSYPLKVFGRHNLLNLNGARTVCRELGVGDEEFLDAMTSFQGASGRLEVAAEGSGWKVFRDFAHSPSKLAATTRSVKEQFPGRQLLACMELHTYSSLNASFMGQYRDTLKYADIPVVYFNPHALQIKRLPAIDPQDIINGFNDKRITVFNDSRLLKEFLLGQSWSGKNLLMMSSGNFDGLDIGGISRDIQKKSPGT